MAQDSLSANLHWLEMWNPALSKIIKESFWENVIIQCWLCSITLILISLCFYLKIVMILSSIEKLQITTQVAFVFRITMPVCIFLSVGPSTPICIIRLISLDFRPLLQPWCSEPTIKAKEQSGFQKERKKKNQEVCLYYFTFSKSRSACSFCKS